MDAREARRRAAWASRAVLHAVDCEKAPPGFPVLGVEQALTAAEHPATRACALCGAGAELDPILRGFDPHENEDGEAL
ncbi:DUF6233 domain-containing protein [Streptomyces sp. NPDC060243]|uniref:DUF6233 domain-containing protein n=1 Tax=Streptomyces sp. NPDC060243 TaxID=3347081 RepID=UPI00365ABA60